MGHGYFAKTLYQKRKTIIWWFIGLAAVTFFTTIFFTALKDSNIGQVFNTLPQSLQQVTGGAKSFNTISAYIAGEIFALRAPVLLSILSIIVFSRLTVGEERKGLLESQIALPLTRKKIFSVKLLCAIVVLGLVSLGMVLGIKVGLILIHTHYSLIKILEESLECFILSLDFGLITLFLNSMFGTRGLVIGLSTLLIFSSYLLSTIAISVKSLRGIDKISPPHYYQNLAVFNAHNTEVLVGIGLILIVLSFLFFIKRDIKT